MACHILADITIRFVRPKFKREGEEKKAKKSHALTTPAIEFLQRPVEYSKTSNSHVPEGHTETSNAVCLMTL